MKVLRCSSDSNSMTCSEITNFYKISNHGIYSLENTIENSSYICSAISGGIG